MSTGIKTHNHKSTQQSSGNNVYDWFIRKDSIDKIIKEIATERYNTTYYNEVFNKIDKLPPEQAKKYLKDLIKNEPLVGIKIMKS